MPKRRAKLIYKGTERELKDRLEIGRSPRSGSTSADRIELDDPTVSWRHCVVTQDAEGRFRVRDLSRNGTRVDGRRLIPNVEFEIQPGQTLTVGPFDLRLDAEGSEAIGDALPPAHDSTVTAAGLVFVTLLVGDIRRYTTLNQKEDAARITTATRRVFSELEGLIEAHGGSLKEYQGDAVFAFWEASGPTPTDNASRAMEAALALDARVRELAADPEVWPFAAFPLEIDFALATGGVVISSLGKDRTTGMSMVGDAVNVAFRIEKMADDETGPIIVCEASHRLAAQRFEFDDLGEVDVRGREGKVRIYALRGPRPDSSPVP